MSMTMNDVPESSDTYVCARRRRHGRCPRYSRNCRVHGPRCTITTVHHITITATMTATMTMTLTVTAPIDRDRAFSCSAGTA